MDISTLDNTSQRELLDAIEAVLDSRVHKRLHMGEEILVKGSLSKALKIPELKRKLQRKKPELQQDAQQLLIELWFTLSEATRQSVLEHLNWYDPLSLAWDDPRSNRRPQ